MHISSFIYLAVREVSSTIIKMLDIAYGNYG